VCVCVCLHAGMCVPMRVCVRVCLRMLVGVRLCMRACVCVRACEYFTVLITFLCTRRGPHLGAWPAWHRAPPQWRDVFFSHSISRRDFQFKHVEHTSAHPVVSPKLSLSGGWSQRGVYHTIRAGNSSRCHRTEHPVTDAADAKSAPLL